MGTRERASGRRMSAACTTASSPREPETEITVTRKLPLVDLTAGDSVEPVLDMAASFARDESRNEIYEWRDVRETCAPEAYWRAGESEVPRVDLTTRDSVEPSLGLALPAIGLVLAQNVDEQADDSTGDADLEDDEATALTGSRCGFRELPHTVNGKALLVAKLSEGARSLGKAIGQSHVLSFPIAESVRDLHAAPGPRTRTAAVRLPRSLVRVRRGARCVRVCVQTHWPFGRSSTRAAAWCMRTSSGAHRLSRSTSTTTESEQTRQGRRGARPACDLGCTHVITQTATRCRGPSCMCARGRLSDAC